MAEKASASTSNTYVVGGMSDPLGSIVVEASSGSGYVATTAPTSAPSAARAVLPPSGSVYYRQPNHQQSQSLFLNTPVEDPDDGINFFSPEKTTTTTMAPGPAPLVAPVPVFQQETFQPIHPQNQLRSPSSLTYDVIAALKKDLRGLFAKYAMTLSNSEKIKLVCIRNSVLTTLTTDYWELVHLDGKK